MLQNKTHMEKVIDVDWETSKKMFILEEHEVDDSNENMSSHLQKV